MEKETLYMYIHTGSVDTEEGWVTSYDKEELEEDGYETAEEAWRDHVGKDFVEVVEIIDADGKVAYEEAKK